MNIFLEMFLGAFSGQTHVKIFCFKSLNYYLKMHKMLKFPLGGIMLLRESLEEIDDFRVKRCRKFEFGPPSADTILRVFRNVNADKIEKVFIKWAHGIYEKVKIEPDRTIVAIDGKDDVRLKQGHGSKGNSHCKCMGR